MGLCVTQAMDLIINTAGCAAILGGPMSSLERAIEYVEYAYTLCQQEPGSEFTAEALAQWPGFHEAGFETEAASDNPKDNAVFYLAYCVQKVYGNSDETVIAQVLAVGNQLLALVNGDLSSVEQTNRTAGMLFNLIGKIPCWQDKKQLLSDVILKQVDEFDERTLKAALEVLRKLEFSISDFDEEVEKKLLACVSQFANQPFSDPYHAAAITQALGCLGIKEREGFAWHKVMHNLWEKNIDNLNPNGNKKNKKNEKGVHRELSMMTNGLWHYARENNRFGKCFELSDKQKNKMIRVLHTALEKNIWGPALSQVLNCYAKLDVDLAAYPGTVELLTIRIENLIKYCEGVACFKAEEFSRLLPALQKLRLPVHEDHDFYHLMKDHFEEKNKYFTDEGFWRALVPLRNWYLSLNPHEEIEFFGSFKKLELSKHSQYDERVSYFYCLRRIDQYLQDKNDGIVIPVANNLLYLFGPAYKDKLDDDERELLCNILKKLSKKEVEEATPQGLLKFLSRMLYILKNDGEFMTTLLARNFEPLDKVVAAIEERSQELDEGPRLKFAEIKRQFRIGENGSDETQGVDQSSSSSATTKFGLFKETTESADTQAAQTTPGLTK